VHRVPNVTTVDLGGYYKMKERDSRMRTVKFVIRHAPRLQRVLVDNVPVAEVCVLVGRLNARETLFP
jgi:hypothetical protein